MVYEYLETYKAAANETGMVARMSNMEVSLEDKRAIISDKMDIYKFDAGNLFDTNGKGVTVNTDISDRPFFKTAVDGITTVSNVTFNEVLKKYCVTIAAPVWQDGKFGGRVVGVVCFSLDALRLSDITNKIQVGDTGGAYLLDAANYTIAHKNPELVTGRDNTLEAFKTDAKLAPLAELESRMTAGEAGFGTYSYNGSSKILAFAPVPGGQGWSLAVNAELNEFLRGTYIAIGITAALVIGTIIVGVIISMMLANSIIKPIRAVQSAAVEMASGNFDIELTHTSKDETGILADSMRQMISTTKAIIIDTSRGLNEMAKGNFNIAPRVEYIGVFKDIETAMKKIVVGLSSTLLQIRTATEQVSSGAEQVSSGAQALAQGTTEQASSVEELSASINEVSNQIRGNATNAADASKLAVTVGHDINTSNEQMTQMMGAMGEINSSSTEISKIIKTIEDIAFQTNILALNAAVEAARAGSAGKGFAVVADEVRNLATKSSEAAKQTNVLIEGSVKSVSSGVSIAEETAKSLQEVVQGAQKITTLIGKISEASAEQASSIAQINIGVEQISAVVQTNSATSEESAASSEELNSQANMMKELVEKFQLLDINSGF